MSVERGRGGWVGWGYLVVSRFLVGGGCLGGEWRVEWLEGGAWGEGAILIILSIAWVR